MNRTNQLETSPSIPGAAYIRYSSEMQSDSFSLDAQLRQIKEQAERGVIETRSAVIRMLEKYAIAARIEPIGPHALRHTFATRYLNANPGDLRGLAALLGHASLNTVMIYTEPSMEDLAKRMEKVML